MGMLHNTVEELNCSWAFPGGSKQEPPCYILSVISTTCCNKVSWDRQLQGSNIFFNAFYFKSKQQRLIHLEYKCKGRNKGRALLDCFPIREICQKCHKPKEWHHWNISSNWSPHCTAYSNVQCSQSNYPMHLWPNCTPKLVCLGLYRGGQP